ncbi:MAG: thiamine pyrophosphate-dependent dehydrogenase E1 component subunit alpha [Deltaproteobacteria bacterium]|nr:thiamine pyrophosphate-dependent dehydrogenase E1 component subunit alpha [Deltaproteobacteria bacterium]MBW2285113.1 thiamine pyrophosphate-dependent dehydrogenase E1 component subunit alpha [Deltaproteobacteria bacterium]
MKLEKDDFIKLYKNMVLGRKIDLITIEGLATGKVLSFFHSSQGSEGLAAGVASFLRDDDYLFPHHRGHGIVYLISKGCSGMEFLAEHYGHAGGSCKGISGFHSVDPEHGILGSSGTIGSQFPLTLGWGLAAKKNGREQVAVGCFGDGGSNRGTLHEAFNLSAIWRLPIVWVCDNNGVAQYTPIADAYPKEDIADLADGYGMPGIVVDGMDVLAVHEVVQAAVARARAGEGPSLIEAKTYRYRTHSEGSPDVYHFEPRPPELVEKWKKRDPIKSFEEKLLAQNILTKKDIEKIDKELQAEADEMDRLAAESGKPDPSVLDSMLYAE